MSPCLRAAEQEQERVRCRFSTAWLSTGLLVVEVLAL